MEPVIRYGILLLHPVIALAFGWVIWKQWSGIRTAAARDRAIAVEDHVARGRSVVRWVLVVVLTAVMVDAWRLLGPDQSTWAEVLSLHGWLGSMTAIGLILLARYGQRIVVAKVEGERWADIRSTHRKLAGLVMAILVATMFLGFLRVFAVL